MENKYKVLNKQMWSDGEYAIIPIRNEDRYKIMQWRNEQIYHLRQSEPLTMEMQDAYFKNVVNKLFDKEHPNQLLFSFLEGEKCIGYGGLVHINWIDRNAEVSFVMNTELEENRFVELWSLYLNLMEKVAFEELSFHKIFTYAFDLRPKLYSALALCGFEQEARLKEHIHIQDNYKDVLIHAKHNTNNNLTYRIARHEDVKLIFDWANEPEVRENALNSQPIKWEDHLNWFNKVVRRPDKTILIFCNGKLPVGQVRIEKIGNEWKIDYSVSRNNRGKGIGKRMIDELISIYPNRTLYGEVKVGNTASKRVFEKCGFEATEKKQHGTHRLIIYKKVGGL